MITLKDKHQSKDITIGFKKQSYPTAGLFCPHFSLRLITTLKHLDNLCFKIPI